VTNARVAALLAALLLAPLPGRAQDSPPAPNASTAPAPVASPEASSFKSDEIGKRAEDVAAQLRAMTEAIADQAAFSALEIEVLQYSHRIADRWRETDKILAAAPRRAPLVTLASSWRALRTELVGLRAEVDRRAELREADLATLDRLQGLWRWTLDHARGVGAPEPVLGRVQETLAAIDATRAQVEARHGRVLVLQDALSRATQACDDAIARIADAHRDAVGHILVRNLDPVWSRARPDAALEAGAGLRAPPFGAYATILESVTIYVQAYRAGFALTLGIAALLVWSLYRMRASMLRGLAAPHAALPVFVSHVLRAPLASALILTLILSRPLRPDPPAVLQQLSLLIGFPAALILLRPTLDPRLMRAFLASSIFFLADVARGSQQLSSGAEQVVLIVEMAAAATLLFWTAALLQTTTGVLIARSPWVRIISRRILLAAALAAVLASLAAAFGYVALADFIGGGTLFVFYSGIGVLAFRVAFGGAVWLALVESPLAWLRAIERNSSRLESAINRMIEVLAVVLWLALVLQRFELLDPVLAAVGSVLDARLQAGELSLSVGRVLGFVAVVFGAWLTSRVVVFALEEDVYPRMSLARGVPYAVSTLIRYGLLLAGFFAALATLGLDLTRLTVLVSAFGLGLGFGMQQIINNFVSGLILLFERPVQVGDLVEMKELNGQVLRIGIRSSQIRTAEGAEVIIPNSDLIQNRVTNWTLSDRRRRVTLGIGVAYGTAAERVLALLLDVVRREPRVMTDPAPDALFTGFGASALEFQLRFWTEDPGWMRLRSDIGVAIQEALREARIGMPVTPVEVQVESSEGRGPAPTAR
jgi:potassium-dependent mechanosensitive channel